MTGKAYGTTTVQVGVPSARAQRSDMADRVTADPEIMGHSVGEDDDILAGEGCLAIRDGGQTASTRQRALGAKQQKYN